MISLLKYRLREMNMYMIMYIMFFALNKISASSLRMFNAD